MSARPRRVVVITGASRGIGAALAERLARRGDALVLLARDGDRLAAVAVDSDALRVAADVTDRDAVRGAVAQAIERFGGVDVLVNNAGVGLSGVLYDLDPAALERVFRINVVGALHAIQAVLPAMRTRGGHIVNVSSILGKVAVPQTAGYAATKFALQALSDGLRVEEAPYGIAVTVICPGSTETDFRANEVQAGSLLVRERPRVAAVSADAVAAVIERALVRRPREVITSGFGRLLNALDSAAPQILDRILRRTYHR